MEKLSLDSDSNPESTGIVEKPLPLETVCEQIAVLCEKLQGHGKNKSDRIDNGQPRCSNNEPNDIEHKLLNSMNDESSESAGTFYSCLLLCTICYITFLSLQIQH